MDCCHFLPTNKCFQLPHKCLYKKKQASKYNTVFKGEFNLLREKGCVKNQQTPTTNNWLQLQSCVCNN